MKLHGMKYVKGARGHKTKVAGRGFGSGSKRGFRGQDGQKKIRQVRVGFEGGQTPLYRKLPKFGFNNYLHRTNYKIITLKNLISWKLSEVNPQVLVEKKIISNEKTNVKIIGNTKLDFAINVKNCKVTSGAKKEIENAGGKVE